MSTMMPTRIRHCLRKKDTIHILTKFLNITQSRIKPPRYEHHPEETLDIVFSTDSELPPGNEGPVSSGNQLKDLKTELAEMRTENKQMHKQTQEQLEQTQELLKSSVKAILTQTYELIEYQIPRLFIVLPEVSTSRNLVSEKFRLYFLCECEDQPTEGTTPHYIHLAKHQGYEIVRPNDFFRKYGPHILTIFKMLKYGVSVAGIAIPPLVGLVQGGSDAVSSKLKKLIGPIESGMNKVVDLIVEINKDDGEVIDGWSDNIPYTTLDGPALRRLETFLRDKDEDRALGNLYRTVTSKGHVKWVCSDHFRDCLERETEAFLCRLKQIGGSFKENLGRVEVRLPKEQAKEFYQGLVKARFVNQLSIELGWETARGDFKKLGNTLAQTNLAALNIVLKDRNGPITDILNRRRRYDPIFKIMAQPSIQFFATDGPKKFIKRSSLKSSNFQFINLRHLDIDLEGLRYDISGLKLLIGKATNLSSVAFKTGTKPLLQVYIGVSEHRTYSVSFPYQPHHISPKGEQPQAMTDPHISPKDEQSQPAADIPILPTAEQSQPTTDLENMSDLLKVLGRRMERVKLANDALNDTIVAGLDKAIAKGSKLGEPTLEAAERDLGEQCIKVLDSIVLRSEALKLDIHLENEEDRIRILESIRWEHRNVEIYTERGSMGMRVIKSLGDGTTKIAGGVELEEFEFFSDTRDPLSMPQDGPLSTFLSTRSFKKLQLMVAMELEHVLSLFKSADLSRLEELHLWADGFETAKVDELLNVLQDAKELQHINLYQANITEEQMGRMKEKNKTLANEYM